MFLEKLETVKIVVIIPIFTINNHRFLCVCGHVPHASAPLTGPIFMIFLHLDREFTGDDARLFHFSFGALWSPVLR